MRTPLVAVLLLGASALAAQSDYTGAIGARIGTPFGLSAKVFMTGDLALEGYFGSRRRGFETGLLGLLHRDIGWRGDFNWYAGAGAHLGFSEYAPVAEGGGRTQSTFGVGGAVGLEYTWRTLPLNLALDWKPEYNFTGVTGPVWASGAISVRYVFR